jgi:membrane-bound lytic murein transglycosylase B
MAFPQFLAQLEQDAQKAGVSRRAIAAAEPYLVFDQGIVNRDRGQRVFGQIFTQFAARMAADYRMQQGRQHLQRHAQSFARAEKEYGVPGGGDRRLLGARKRLRRQHGQAADAALAGLARL